ncbi:membrane protein [Streptomyces spiroverticillatus]|uniref:Membrane protein n=1 Tax=Streptomyces finlayi TaxID=67296 RepID=A0A919CFN1_9ACTN|nr:LysM peptidoglycan-binding domain-containing protein [Streptomyces finlayi]GHA46473.1 membrane protein [Streptomyces spiroverticillatus]GHD16258.1 membrane protein [Streptomyces finlayi]
MAPRTPRPLRALTASLRAVCGLAVLAALVGGVPYVLLAVGHQPTELTGGWQMLVRQDDGTLFLVVLTLIGWAAWALFALSVLVEIVAVVRRRSTPRIKGLGGMQSLAGFLVGAILVLAPTAASAATATPAAAVTQSLNHDTAETAAAPAASVTRATATLRHTVTSPTESPWDLAERFLGNGQRWKDLAALNPEVPALAAGDAYVPQGTVIALPADARTDAPSSPPAQASTTTVSAPQSAAGTSRTPAPARAPQADNGRAGEAYVVQPGDHLAKIAHERLGDADRWPELYEANKGEKQPYGHHFENPDLIYPGQQIDLPAGATAVPPVSPEAEKKPTPKPTQPTDPAPAPPAPSASGGPTSGTDQGKGTGGADRQQERDRAATPKTPPPTATPASPVPPQKSDSPEQTRPPQQAGTPTPSASSAGAPSEQTGSETGQTVAAIGLAASGAVAAALVGTLASRRLLQRRKLRRGRKIVMPQGRPAATEVLLRSVDASYELQLLDAMVRTLGTHLAEQERVLPALAAVRLGEQGALLYLEEPAEPAAPFTALDEEGLQWWCPIDSEQLLDEDELREIDPPYPALVPLGDDTQGGIVLVDLERIGVLHLVGGMRQQILRTLAIALALSPLGGQLELAVAGEDTAPGLTMLDPERVLAHGDLPGAVRALAAHQAEQQQVLEGCALGGLAAARLDGEVGELWPMVLLTDLDTCPGAEDRDALRQVVGVEPGTALAVLTSTGAVPAEDDEGWVVDTDAAEVTVPGTDVRCVLSACSDEEYADVIDLVLVSSLGDEDDHAAPATSAPAPAPRDAGVTAPPGSAAPSSGGPSEPAGPTRLPLPASSSPLAALADLDDDPDGEPIGGTTPVSGPAPSLPAPTKPVPGSAEETPAPAPPPATGTAPLPGASPAAAASPSEIVIPSLVPVSRVSARIPAGQPAAPFSPLGTTVLSDEVPEVPDGPYVQVLGQVALDGAQGSIPTGRRTTALEFAVWLALHPGADRHQINELLAPGGGQMSRDTRNSRTTDVRRWLGTSPEGDPYLPHLNHQPDRLLRLTGVACDWDLFQQHAGHGHQDPGPHGTRLLHQALCLVRGRPFSGVPPRRYQWAAALTEEMIKKIVHVAQDLAERHLAAGDGRSALWAATRGLDIAREVEVLWRCRFRALALLGQHRELENAVQALEAFLLELGCAMEEETVELLQQLQPSHH